MIRHICMFSLREEGKEEHAAEFLRRGEELAKLSFIRAAQVVRCAPSVPNANYDVALLFDFETLDDLNAYQVSPEHVAFGQFISAVRTGRACIDYEV